MANVAPIFVAPTLNLLHHNNARVIYFKMELVRFVPLYFMAMPHSMVTITKTPFTTTTHFIVGMKYKPHTPRGIDLVSVHMEMPIEVNYFFVG